ncbi:MAG TPA: penicillin-binding transpeptidase domain-containing protein [Thermoanaerobaculia bacterium]|jgi:hypothetical protein
MAKVTPPKSGKPIGCLPLFIALLVLVGGLTAVTWIPLRNARAAWRDGRNAEAVEEAERWSKLRVWPRQYHQVLAAALLTVGNRPGAKPHLDALRGGQMWISALPKEEVAQKLFSRGRYADFLDYDAAVDELRDSDETRLHRAAALAATEKIAEAEAALKDAGGADPKELEAVRRAISDRRQGSFPYVVDRNGKTIAAFQLANDDVVAMNTDFAALIEREAGALTIESQSRRIGTFDTIETTLDSATQKAALASIAGFRASLVAIDPETNEILAIASNRGGGPLENLAIEHRYEPGSVMKVLTGMAAIAHGVDVKTMFPYNCTGHLEIDGRQFGDWLEGGHGSLVDFDEALARSCNVVFADIGLRTGLDNLRATHKSAGFDGKADLALIQPPLGATEGRIFNNFETGFYSIGLEHESITTLHLAMLASMMANRGELTTPRFLRARRSILGEEVAAAPRQAKQRVVPAEVAERMIVAMRAVVTREHGTGRRAAVDGVTLAMKTGTAGKRENGYHALVMAFAPVEKPKIAFALIAEESGPAEFTAAKMAHDFLTALKSGPQPRL